MKRVLMIGTGGTIASEMTGAGLVPELTTDQFLKYVPAVRELCDVTCRQVCNIDSTNMSPAYWLEIDLDAGLYRSVYRHSISHDVRQGAEGGLRPADGTHHGPHLLCHRAIHRCDRS